MARGARWHVIQGEIPLKVTGVSGGIYNGYTSTVTIQIDPDSVTKSKATAAHVLYWVGGSLVFTQSNVPLPASGALAFKTPSNIYNLIYGTVVTMTVQNSTTGTDGKGEVSHTIWQMPYGGSKYEVGDYIYHKFTSTGDWTNTLPALPGWFLVVSGGGGGSGENGAGGGAGGVVNTTGTFSQQAYRATIAGGGGGGHNSRPGTYGGNGGNSSFAGYTPTGGGTGGYRYVQGKTGGSGGGAGCDNNINPGASGISGQGQRGGGCPYVADPYQSGGGGGHSGVGVSGGGRKVNVWNDGGAGITWHDGQKYAGGGGGTGVLLEKGSVGNAYYGRGWGGTAGNGNAETIPSTAAPANRGGGGGGGSRVAAGFNLQSGGVSPGRPGGSGVVVIRYQKPQ